jgi:hypothetical protein
VDGLTCVTGDVRQSHIFLPDRSIIQILNA